jgi:hypothetical protein
MEPPASRSPVRAKGGLTGQPVRLQEENPDTRSTILGRTRRDWTPCSRRRLQKSARAARLIAAVSHTPELSGEIAAVGRRLKTCATTGRWQALSTFHFRSVRSCTCRVVAASRAAGIGRRHPGGRAGTAVLRSVRARCRGDQGVLPATSVSRQHHLGLYRRHGSRGRRSPRGGPHTIGET